MHVYVVCTLILIKMLSTPCNLKLTTLPKLTLLYKSFSRFLNFKNVTKSRKASRNAKLCEIINCRFKSRVFIAKVHISVTAEQVNSCNFYRIWRETKCWSFPFGEGQNIISVTKQNRQANIKGNISNFKPKILGVDTRICKWHAKPF